MRGWIVWVELDGAAKFSFSGGLIPRKHGKINSEGGVRLRQRIIDLNCPNSRGLCFRHRFLGKPDAVASEQFVAFSHARVSESVIRVFFDRLIVELNRLLERFARSFVPLETPFE